MSAPMVLVADDDASIRLVMSQTLLQEGYRVRATDSAEALMKWVKAGEGDVVVTDVYMGEGSIFDRLPELKRLRPDLPVIVISARSTILTATAALEHGALDYLPKPFRIDALAEKVARALDRVPQRDRVERQRRQSQRDADLPLLGRSPAMQQVYRVISRVMNTDFPVLLTGETGTGKARTAHVIHDLSRRKDLPFIDMGDALSEPGPLDDAESAARFVEAARGGTLLADAVDEMTPAAHRRLTRVLDALEALQTPGAAPARLIATITASGPLASPPAGVRDDLFHRINVIAIHLPALRERREDIADLASALLEARSRDRQPVRRLDPAALSLLSGMNWPGNVRELANLIVRLSVLAPHEIISPRDVLDLAGAAAAPADAEGASLETALGDLLARHVQPKMAALREGEDSTIHEDTVQALERPLIAMTLRLTQGNKLRAASLLGMNRNTLRARMKVLGLDSDDPGAGEALV